MKTFNEFVNESVSRTLDDGVKLVQGLPDYKKMKDHDIETVLHKYQYSSSTIRSILSVLKGT